MKLTITVGKTSIQTHALVLYTWSTVRSHRDILCIHAIQVAVVWPWPLPRASLQISDVRSHEVWSGETTEIPYPSCQSWHISYISLWCIPYKTVIGTSTWGQLFHRCSEYVHFGELISLSVKFQKWHVRSIKYTPCLFTVIENGVY